MSRFMSAMQARRNPVWVFVIALFALVPAINVHWRAGPIRTVGDFDLAVGLVCMLFACLVIYVSLRCLMVIHAGIRAAKEGNLKPVKTSATIRFLFGLIIEDYNLLVSNIGSLFNDMEQSQTALIGERNRNDAILRSLPGALLTVDGNFMVTLANNLAEQLFGFQKQELLGQNIFELLQLNDEGRDVLREAFLYEQQINNREIVLTNGNLSRCYALNLAFFRESLNASDYCAAVMLQDITDVKQMHELITRSEKFLAIGQLAGGVAHELNTPLGTIVGYAQLLNEGVVSETRRQEYSEVIYREAKRCSRIIENLRTVAQRDVCRVETCRINAVIAEVVDTICNCPSKNHHARIETRLGEDATVLGGAGQLDIVLVNVIMNGIQAAEGTTMEPLVTIGSAVRGDKLVVSIADNGPGVPDAQRSQVFDPFFTTKKDCAGTGLGLAISQSIVTRIGGDLSYDINYRGGARFVLTLPLAERGAG